MSELSTGIKLELSDGEKFDYSYREVLAKILTTFIQALVKSAYQKNDFLISQPKHMLWVLKRTVSMRWFF